MILIIMSERGCVELIGDCTTEELLQIITQNTQDTDPETIISNNYCPPSDDFYANISSAIFRSHLRKISLTLIYDYKVISFAEYYQKQVKFRKLFACLSQRGEEVESVELNGFQMKEGVIDKFKKGRWKKLNELRLLECKINWKGIKGIIEGKMKCLKVLDLSGNNITNRGIKAIAKAEFECMQQIELNSVGVTFDSLMLLSRLQFNKLQSIKLANNNLEHLSSLCHLSFSVCLYFTRELSNSSEENFHNIVSKLRNVEEDLSQGEKRLLRLKNSLKNIANLIFIRKCSCFN